METFQDKLERLEIATRMGALPEGLGEWACAALKELARIREQRDSLPVAVAKALRNDRITAAAMLLAEPSPYRSAALLHAHAAQVARQWTRLGAYDLGADSPLAHLHAANGWYELPSERTYLRLLTKQG
ncbi:hypothetical protein ACFQ2D_08365 [Luteimonas composti]|uniref:hypothetical protein n=1 Tax=Luteimonas composti TaxID=398257 RepID=UPI003636ED13